MDNNKIQPDENLDLYKTIDAIAYSLKVIPRDFEDTKEFALICKTILKLPIEVKEKVVNEVLFVMMLNDICGYYDFIFVRKSVKECKTERGLIRAFFPTILLNFASMRELSISQKMDLIAHEIAHHVCGRDYEGLKNGIAVHEKDADELIKKWGFKPVYKNYKSELR